MYMDEIMKKSENRYEENRTEIIREGKEIEIDCLLVIRYHIVLFDESEKNLKVIAGRFVELCKRSLKVNPDENKVTVLG